MPIVNTYLMFNEFLKEKGLDITKLNNMEVDSIYSIFLEEIMDFDPIEKEQMQDALDELYFLA